MQSKGEKFFIGGGLNIVKPIDLLVSGEYAKLKNIRSYNTGSINSRPGTTQVNTSDALGSTNIHSIKQLNDSSSGSNVNIYVLGVDTTIRTLPVTGTTSTSRDTGYSGNPLSFVNFRPSRSPSPWSYIADSNKMSKVSSAGLAYTMGIPPPNVAPTLLHGAPSENIIEDFTAVGSWTNTATAGAITASTTNRISTTIDKVTYNSSSNWCSFSIVAPATASQKVAIQAGARIALNGTESTIQAAFPGFPATTISAITYDSGSTGACTITLTSLPATSADATGPAIPALVPAIPASSTDLSLPTPYTRSRFLAIQPGLLVTLTNGTPTTENVIVTSSTVGPDGSVSFRASTTATFAATNTITGLQTFRTYLAGLAAGQTVQGADFSFQVTVGTGTIQETIASTNLAVAAGRTLQPADEFHISINIDALANLSEGRVIFNVDPADTTFTKNYYYFAFRSNDLTPAVLGTSTSLSARTTAIQRYQSDVFDPSLSQYSIPDTSGNVDQNYGQQNFSSTVDPTDPSGNTAASDQTVTGATQWNELRFMVSDLQRVGADNTKTLANCTGIQLSFNCTGTINVLTSALYIRGSYGPDIGTIGSEYYYRFRYRSAVTGAKSNAGPPTRNGVRPHRQQVVAAVTASSNAQVDTIDIFRWGGTLTSWNLVGSTSNSTGNFNDNYDDNEISTAEQLDFADYQPFPITGLPTGGVVTITGTTWIRTSGDNFNVNWAPGNLIQVNANTVYTLYKVISTSVLEVVESGGSQTSITWNINAPLIMGQPLQCLWGPYGEGLTALFNFAVGDGINPGRLYWTKGNDSDSTTESSWIDITTPSDPLMNGCIYDNISWTTSTKRWWAIIPTFGSDNEFQAIEKPVGKGLFSRWFMCPTPYGVFFGAEDGIYNHQGGQAQSITDASLYSIFPHEGVAQVTTNGYVPPDYAGHPNNLRLSYNQGYLYFDYIGTDSIQHTLVYDAIKKAWLGSDVYNRVAIVHYQQEGQGFFSQLYGSTDGFLYKLDDSVNSDSPGTVAISGEILTRSDDRGDLRSNKQWYDGILDCSTGSTAILPTIGLNNNSTIFTIPTVTSTNRAQSILDFTAGLGDLARNLCLDLTWSGTSAINLFAYDFTIAPRPETTGERATELDDDGSRSTKWLQGCVIEFDTFGQNKTVQVFGDNSTLIATLTLNSNGRIELPFSWVGAYTHQMRLVPTDTTNWLYFGMRWVYTPAPELTTTWESNDLSLNSTGYWHIRQAYISVLSTSDVTLTVTIDGVAYTYTIPAGAGTRDTKTYLPLQAVKGLIYRFKLTSTNGFRLFMQDCEILHKSWNSNNYTLSRPFGDVSAPSGSEVRI